MRSGQFTKVSKLITIAAKSGGDPSSNFSLRIAVDKARAVGMPKDNIERAIKRGTGELEGAQIEEVLYECYGPGGVAVLVKCLTDNKNRAVSDIKHIFSDHGGSMAGAGSVLWMFAQMGVVTVLGSQFSVHREENELALIEAGAEEIKDSEENELEIYTKMENFQKVLGVLKEIGVETKESGLQWIAKDKVEVNTEVAEKLGALFSELEENDDVDDYFTNAE